MADVDPRRRMMSLRLSEIEYEALKAQCDKCGARNVSELARLALQRILEAPVDLPGNLPARLADLDDRVQALESLVSRIMLREVAKV